MIKNKQKGFTLIELLIVIAIIGLLAAVVLIAINPQEMMRRGRDSQRLSDLTNLRKAIDVMIATEYTFDCDVGTCDGRLTSAEVADYRLSNGGGWLDHDLSGELATLPVDPVNGASVGVAIDEDTRANRPAYYYAYIDSTADTYEINCYLESFTNTGATANNNKYTSDGGDSPYMFETGTDLTLMNAGDNGDVGAI